MKILDQGINPNCSEIIVRLGIPSTAEIEHIKSELRDIVNSTDARLGWHKTIWRRVDDDNRRASLVGDIDINSIKVEIDEDGNIDIESDETPTWNSPGKGTEIRDLEEEGWTSIVFYLEGNEAKTRWEDNTASLCMVGGEMCLMISDSDRAAFAVIAHIIDKMGYHWQPYDGGHGDGFEEYCRSVGLDHVADRGYY